MTRMKNYLTAFLLTLTALMLLSACGGREEDALTGQVVYVPENVAFTSELQTVSDGCVMKGAVYLLGRTGDTRNNNYQLIRLSPEGGEAEALPDYQSGTDNIDSFFLFGTLRAGPDGTLWAMERLMRQSYDEEARKYVQEEIHVLRRLDENGKELARLEYAGLEEKLGLGTVFDLLIDGDDDVFAQASEGIALLDEAGEARFTIGSEDWHSGNLILLGDGRMGMTYTIMDAPGEYTASLRMINKETGDLGEGYQLASGTSSLVSVYDGEAEALFYYRIGDTLRVWREGAGESEQVANLLDIGIESYTLNVVAFLDKSRLVIQSGSGYSDTDRPSLDILMATDAGLVRDKKVLTYATIQLVGSQRNAIMAFNKSNPDYHISVTDYSQYGGREAAMTRLATEIGAGKMPDIIDLYAIPVSRWAANGLLEDLWPYIDSDPEISRDALMDRVFQAAEINGKLYQIGPYFGIDTLTGVKSVVGDRMTWTGADMWKALEAMPADCVPTSDSRTSMLARLMELDWSRFVDWEAGTCDFTCQEFKSLLEFCADFPADALRLGEKGVYEERQMLLSMVITGFEFPQRARFLLGGDVAYVGYPNEWGKVGSSVSFISSAAMSSACKDKEGAWTFLRTLLLPRGETGIKSGAYAYFPVNRADFQKAAELAMTPAYLTYRDGTYELDDNGEKIETSSHSELFQGIAQECMYYAATQEDYDQLMALYNAIDTYTRWDPGLEPIITEVAGAYFAGDKSLDETAELIQNRASLYVNEQT